MPLHLAQHKSYHPYNEKNKERVRRDEEQEQRRLETEDRQRQDAESDARIEALRRAKGIETARGTSSAGSSSSGQHINFFSDLERSSGSGSGSRSSNTTAGASRLDRHDRGGPASAAQDRETLAHALGGPSAADDRQPWYASADLQSARQRRKSSEQKLEASYRDAERKKQQDPMNIMNAVAALRTEKSQKRKLAMEKAKAKESPYRAEGSSSSMWAESGDYSDQFNRDDVRAARKRRRGSSPSPSSQYRDKAADSEKREGKRRAYDDDDDRDRSRRHSRPSADRGAQEGGGGGASSSNPTIHEAAAQHGGFGPLGNHLFHSSDQDLPGRSDEGKLESPCLTRAPVQGPTSSQEALSFPPCGQIPRIGNPAPYLHDAFPQPHPHVSRNVNTTTLFPTFSPSSSFEDVKKEPNSDDIPIVNLVGTESERSSRSPAKNASTGAALPGDDMSDSEMDHITPSPLERKVAIPSSNTHSTDQLHSSSSAQVSHPPPRQTSSLDPLQKVLSDLKSDSPSIKEESSPGQVRLSASESGMDVEEHSPTHSGHSHAFRVKDEQYTPQMPSSSSSAHNTESPRITEGGLRQSGDDHSDPTEEALPRAPLTLIDAQRIGLNPPLLKQGYKLPTLTQGSEFDELGPGNTQATVAEQPVPQDTEEQMHVGDPSTVDMDKVQHEQDQTDGDASVEVEGADGAPARSQQRFWAGGIWRPQLEGYEPVVLPNAFDLMRSAAKRTSALNAVAAAKAEPVEKIKEERSGKVIAESRSNTESPTDERTEGDLLPGVSADVEVKIRESMYPTALSEMINTVLEHEDFLFSANEVAFLRSYKSLTYEARYLFSRLIQRKHQWYRVEWLNRYDRDIKDMATAVQTLTSSLPELEAQHSQHVRDASTADDPLLTRFACTQREPGVLEDVTEMLDMMKVDELKILAKKMSVLKPSLTTRADLTAALLAVRHQSTLSRFGGSPSKPQKASASISSPTKPQQKCTAAPAGSPSKQQSSPSKNPFRQLTLNFDTSGKKTAQSNLLKNTVQEIIGDAILIPSEVRSLIDRVALVYYRGNVYNSVGNALTLAVLSMSRKRNFPQVEVKRSKDLFKSRAALKRYEKACAQEYKMVLLVDGSFEAKRVAGATPETFIGQAVYNAHEEELPPPASAEATGAAIQLFEEIFQEWKDAVAECERDFPDGEDRIMYHRMRFHPGWPLTRIVYKVTACLGRLKEYEREKEVLTALLAQKKFCRGKRGEWSHRLALITERYMTKDKRRSLQIASDALKDPDTHMIHHRVLRARIVRIENSNAIKIPFHEKHVFTHLETKKCPEVYFSGIRLDRMVSTNNSASSLALNDDETSTAKARWNQLFAKPSSPTKAGRNSFSKSKSPVRADAGKAGSPGQESPAKELDISAFSKRPILEKEVTRERIISSPTKGKGKAKATDDLDGDQSVDAEEAITFEVAGKERTRDMHSVWRGLDGVQCGVEELCLQHYAKDGWKGIHCEGGIIRMLFMMAMWDIIFMPVEGAFETKFQTEPLDMRTDAFAVVRKAEIEERIAHISNTGALDLIKAVDERERPRKTFASACNWDRYSLQDLLEVAECLGGGPLSELCRLFCEEWEHFQGGMPDLCIWKPETKRLRLVEVKGPGDQLRDKQKDWIETLIAAGVRVQVAYVEDKTKMEVDTKKKNARSGPAKK